MHKQLGYIVLSKHVDIWGVECSGTQTSGPIVYRNTQTPAALPDKLPKQLVSSDFQHSELPCVLSHEDIQSDVVLSYPTTTTQTHEPQPCPPNTLPRTVCNGLNNQNNIIINNTTAANTRCFHNYLYLPVDVLLLVLQRGYLLEG